MTFLEAVVASRQVAVGSECEALSDVADRLCTEFGYPLEVDLPTSWPSSSEGERSTLFGSLSPEDERLIAAARRTLVRIGHAVRTKRPTNVPDATIGALLDGAELVMRDELAKGKRLSTVLPSVVFLVAVPAVDLDEALELAERAAALLNETLG
jgi:hypothetical protein